MKYMPLIFSVIFFVLLQLRVWNLFNGLLDEGFLLYNARLITQGFVPYRDFFMTTTPASYYIVALFFRLCGEYMIITRVLSIITGIMTLIICARLFSFKPYWQYLYLFCVALLLVAPAKFFFYNEATLCALVVFALLQHALRTQKVLPFFMAGMVTGVCFLFKQSIGGLVFPASIIGILLLTQRTQWIKFTMMYLLGAVVIVTPVVWYFFSVHALSQAYYFIFIFASEVKSHQSSFLMHRLIEAPLFVCVLWIFIRIPRKTKLLLVSAVGICAFLYLSSNQHMGRLMTYLPDPLFYLQSSAFLIPLCAIGASIQRKMTAAKQQVVLTSLFSLALFLSVGASGYSIEPVTVAALLVIPLLMLTLPMVPSRLQKKISVGVTLMSVGFSVWVLLHPLATLPVTQMTHALPVKETNGIAFSDPQSRDLSKVITYIQSHTSRDEKIFCFPYCPGVLFFSERTGGSFYNLFWFETFQAKDQQQVIADLQRNNVKVVIMQTYTGDFPMPSTMEIARLAILRQYVLDTYHPVFQTANFVIRAR